MSTSGTNTFNLNTNEVVETIFHRLGKASEGEAITARMYEDGRRTLNLLLKSFGAMEHLWTKTEGSLTLVSGQEGYTLSSPRPQRMLSVRRRLTSDSTEIPLTEISRQEYFEMPNKASPSGTPVNWYFDPQRSAGVLYIWPPPSTTVAADNSLRITYLRRIEDVSATTDDIDVPQEWLDAIIWMAADSLETEYPVNDPRLAQKIERNAREAKGLLKSWDTEPASIFMQPETWPV